MQASWERWLRDATPAAQVALDGAQEGLVEHPLDKGFSWAACVIQGEAPVFRPGGPEPGVSWEELAAVRGDIGRVSKRMREPYTGMLLVQVPPGSFYMGATRRAGERNSHPQATSAEGPVRKVTLTKSAWLGRTPVTVAEYRLFTQATHYPEPKTLIPGLINARPDQPVVGVSWFDAQAFVSWLSEKSGLPYCLPSEALWEWAARGSDGRHYPWGKKAPNQDSCWLGERFPQDVGKKPANMGPFGNLDQLGNIQEFCQDVWSIWTDDPVTDPLSDDSGWTHFPADQRPEEPFRVLRGCGIPTSMPAQRVSMRVQVRPHHFFHWYGFRVALPVER